jgi:hypothetical protein
MRDHIDVWRSSENSLSEESNGFRSYGPAGQRREYLTDPNDQDRFNLLCNAGRFSAIGSRLHYIL